MVEGTGYWLAEIVFFFDLVRTLGPRGTFIWNWTWMLGERFIMVEPLCPLVIARDFLHDGVGGLLLYS